MATTRATTLTRRTCTASSNFARALTPQGPDSDDKLAIAAAFHDLAAFHTLDYLVPSIKAQDAWLQQTGREDWSDELALIVAETSSAFPLRPDPAPDAPLVEAFRRADLVDVSQGLIRFGIPNSYVTEVRAAFDASVFFRRVIPSGTLRAIRTLQQPGSCVPATHWSAPAMKVSITKGLGKASCDGHEQERRVEMTADVDPSVPPSGVGCVDCDANGGWWVHLRRCAACGHIGCCDDSLSRHATAHWREAADPIIRSFEPGEDWFWDYQRNDYYTGPELAATAMPSVGSNRPRSRAAVCRPTGLSFFVSERDEPR